MVVLVLILLGLCMMGFEIWALGARRLVESNTLGTSRAPMVKVTTWLLGSILAVAAVTVSWPYSHNVRILGFPFPTAVFERSGDHWLDFVAPWTLPALLANFVICVLLPPTVLKAYLRSRARGL